MKNILLVEDDKVLSDGIVLSLSKGSYSISQCHTLSSARKQLEKGMLDLIILDINLPDGNGLDFLRECRSNSDVPVILLTANDLEINIVTGLELGANDYITKPFSLAVLRARVNNQLRTPNIGNTIMEDDLKFNFDTMTFFKGDIPIDFSKTEQKLLKILLDNKGLVLSRDSLIDKLWSGDNEYIDSNTLSVLIKRIRDKIEEEPSNPKYIRTLYGVGYVWR